MKILNTIIVSILINFATFAFSNSFNDISGYRPCFHFITDPVTGKYLISLRHFSNKNRSYSLAVDPETLRTKILSTDFMAATDYSFIIPAKNIARTPYLRALRIVSLKKAKYHNAGITKIFNPGKFCCITIDLCPSSKPLDRNLFLSIINSRKYDSPVPVALAASGKWLESHTQDLTWLINMETSGKIKILWINHSYEHPYKHDLSYKKNFMMLKGFNVTDDILKNEQCMLKSGIVPSIFFRFPGLASNKKIMQEVLNLGLIPLGANAWIDKGQSPKIGSIILIHGNGNDAKGVSKFKLMLKYGPVIIAGKSKTKLECIDLIDGFRNKKIARIYKKRTRKNNKKSRS